jgi:hypothetical protein
MNGKARTHWHVRGGVALSFAMTLTPQLLPYAFRDNRATEYAERLCDLGGFFESLKSAALERFIQIGQIFAGSF